jgi:23S rRNA (uracil1939-C5)-methyltransferase
MRPGTRLRDITITHLWYGGVWLCSLPNGKKVLIKWALPGSVVEIMITKSRRDYLEAHIVEVQSVPANLLTGEVRCPHYLFPYQQHTADVPVHKKWCGGCKRQMIAYDQQLQLKQQIIEDCFTSVKGQLGKLPLEPILPAPQQFGYRNKIEFSFGKYLQRFPKESSQEWFAVAEHWNIWFHKQGEFSKVLDIDQCYLISDRMHRVFALMKLYCKKSGLPVYDVKQNQWFWRHLVLREWVATQHIMVHLSIASDQLQHIKDGKKLRQGFVHMISEDTELRALVTTVVITNNNGLADIVTSGEVPSEILRGEWRIWEEMEIRWTTLRFQISPFSFFQTNTWWASLLFSTALSYLQRVPDMIVDLYCGSGTIWLAVLKAWFGKRVIWIDTVTDAIHDANKNAEINDLSWQANFYVGKAEKIADEILQQHHGLKSGDVVIVDPPREWLHEHMRRFLIDRSKKYSFQLVYISCNPLTMARDIQELCAHWFSLSILQPVDMFPHTHHIETIGILFN